MLGAEAAATLLERDPAAARDQVARLQSLAQEALEELRSLVFELRPPELERDGLADALRKHVELLRRLAPHKLELDLSHDGAPDPPRDREVLRIAQEALQNAIKHAGASRIGVRLGAEDGRFVLEVEDDGVGFDPDGGETRARSLGLTSMQERAERLGGRLAISSAPGRGTTVRLELDDG